MKIVILTIPLIKERIQIDSTAIFRLLKETMFEYCIVNLMAMSLSKVTNII